MARGPASRSGTVLCHPSGERWTVELRLDEHDGNQGCQHTVYLNRVFVTETAASRLPHQNSVHVSGSRWAAVSIPASSSITFIWSSSHRVAKILPATRKEGRP